MMETINAETRGVEASRKRLAQLEDELTSFIEEVWPASQFVTGERQMAVPIGAIADVRGQSARRPHERPHRIHHGDRQIEQRNLRIALLVGMYVEREHGPPQRPRTGVHHRNRLVSSGRSGHCCQQVDLADGQWQTARERHVWGKRPADTIPYWARRYVVIVVTAALV